MDLKRYDSKVLVRLDPDEEIISCLTKVCLRENIKLGCVSGIGAVDQATVGLFDPVSKKYVSSTLEKNFEITNLAGNISQMNEAVYLHLHVTLADMDHKAFGGHLNAARVSATAEIWIDIIDGSAHRKLNEVIGLNMLKF